MAGRPVPGWGNRSEADGAVAQAGVAGAVHDSGLRIGTQARRSTFNLGTWGLHLQVFVVGAAAAFGRDPGDDLVGVQDVAGLAVNAVGGVQVNLLAAVFLHHFVHGGRAEVLAGVAELDGAAVVADVGVVDQQVRRLVFLVLGRRVKDVGEPVEGELAIRSNFRRRFRA